MIAGSRDPGAAPLKALKAKAGDRLQTVSLEVTDPASVQDAVSTLGDRPIDVLINNAGTIGPQRQSTLDTDFEGMAETFEINTIAPLRVAQAFLPNLMKSKMGRIVTISSSMGSLAQNTSDRIAYRASKAAVNKVFQGLATDLKSSNIAVIVMHPGWVRTDMGGSNADITPEESAAGILKVADDLTLAKTGQFINYDGKSVPW